ncbi:DNA-directed RNA polymerase specialized sigma24 family protein [Streptacidiphilus sp. MAP12-16]|uniref:hypothetical protein n=1 Tax=Streptacidiphilus sp. MAP12-16 TaxID=3156300 RepID=UPI003514814B
MSANTTTTALEPLHVLEEQMHLLVERDHPLTLFVGDLDEGLPPHPLDLISLRALLLHPSVGHQARGQIWVRLLKLTGQDGTAGEEWRIACCSMALSGLWRTAARLRRQAPALEQDDVQQIVLAGFWEALTDLRTRVDEITEPGRIPASLCWNADRAARRHQELQQRHATRRAELADRPETPQEPAADLRPWWMDLDVHLLLRRAVEQRVIDAELAELIVSTRLKGVPIGRLAREAGTSPETLGMRRRRGEKKIAEAVRAGRLDPLPFV